jgi:hypothetical protein
MGVDLRLIPVRNGQVQYKQTVEVGEEIMAEIDAYAPHTLESPIIYKDYEIYYDPYATDRIVHYAKPFDLRRYVDNLELRGWRNSHLSPWGNTKMSVKNRNILRRLSQLPDDTKIIVYWW